MVDYRFDQPLDILGTELAVFPEDQLPLFIEGEAVPAMIRAHHFDSTDMIEGFK
jgi:hypothetical protein